MDGSNVLTGFTYPTAAAGGIDVAAQLVTDFTVSFAGNVMTVQIPGATAPASCQFTYDWTPVANGSPKILLTGIGGC